MRLERLLEVEGHTLCLCKTLSLSAGSGCPQLSGYQLATPGQDHFGDDISCVSGSWTHQKAADNCNADSKCRAFNVYYISRTNQWWTCKKTTTSPLSYGGPTMCFYTKQSGRGDGDDALAAHNVYRRKHRVVDLRWDNGLAQQAQVRRKCAFSASIEPKQAWRTCIQMSHGNQNPSICLLIMIAELCQHSCQCLQI